MPYIAVPSRSIFVCLHFLLLVLGLCWVNHSLAQESASTKRSQNYLLGELPQQTIGAGDWLVFNTRKELSDGSPLFRYVAQIDVSEASDESPGPAAEVSVDSLRFAFVPRFSCTPLVTVLGSIPADTEQQVVDAALEHFRNLRVSVDGSLIAFPTLVERDGRAVRSFYDTNLQRRATLRILLEVGYSLTMQLGDRNPVEFSLSGSKQAIQAAHARCKNHS